MTTNDDLEKSAWAVLEAAAVAPRPPEAKALLETDWPLPPADAPVAEHYRARLSRAQACFAFARDSALQHYHLQHRLPASPGLRTTLRIAQAIEFHVADPYVYPFDMLKGITHGVIQEDPVFRATRILRSSPSHAQSALCKEMSERVQAPLYLIAEERRAVINLSLARSQEFGHAPTAGDAIARYVQLANAELDRRTGSPSDGAPAAVFRLAGAADAHREFVPLLTRVIDGRQAQVLRPVSGEPTLVLAYATDCRAGTSPGRTVRLRPSNYPERTPAAPHTQPRPWAGTLTCPARTNTAAKNRGA